MEFNNMVSQDMLRQLLDMTPDTNENQNIRMALINMIAAQNVTTLPFTYNAVYYAAGAANALAAGANNIPAIINIQADSDFLILNQTYDANQLNAARTNTALPVPNINLLISDTASSANMSDVAVPVANIFGTAQQPYILPTPKLLKANSNLQILATNVDAAAGYNLRLSFNGVKIYNTGR